ncbi:MAG TPA: EthD domain-containing protein [Steroidobacteraceae bacterium]|nr:EthD domain-containing protein [Steroidobacteraceae bacterium]
MSGYVKLVALLRKRPGMPLEEFRTYYETTHCKLIRLLPGVQRYFRRYLDPIPPGDTEDQPFHVMTELWFKSRGDFELAMQRNSSPDVAAILAEDEAKLFDRDAARLFTVEECYSNLSADPQR